MTSSFHIIHPGVRENPRAFEVQERTKIVRDLQEKYADELGRAPWWKAPLIRVKIQREAARIYRHRLYLTPRTTSGSEK